MLTLDDVQFGFPARPDFLGPITLSVAPGECWAIVGPNGAGKSTLLRLMAGLHRPRSGVVSLAGEALGRMSLRERAKRIAFLPQQMPADLDFRVRELVLMGRFPHRSLALFESAEDERRTEQAMAATQTLEFADRPVATLSGGEAQRVHLAAALAQEPQLLLLDEPTASLDLQHQLAVFQILLERTVRHRLAVVVVTHDVNLAGRFCTHVLLLDHGKPAAVGPPSQVIIPAVLSPVYGVKLAAVTLPGRDDRHWVVPTDAAGEVPR